MSRGGKREGAGRKACADSKSVPKSIRVSREVADYLRDRGTGVIESMIRRTRDFRAWEKGENE